MVTLNCLELIKCVNLPIQPLLSTVSVVSVTGMFIIVEIFTEKFRDIFLC